MWRPSAAAVSATAATRSAIAVHSSRQTRSRSASPARALSRRADALDLIHGNGGVGRHALDDLHGVGPAQIAGKMHRPSIWLRRRAVVLGHRVVSFLAKSCNSLMQIPIRRHSVTRASTHMRPTLTWSQIVASVKQRAANAKALAVPAFPRPPFALSCGAGADLRARA